MIPDLTPAVWRALAQARWLANQLNVPPAAHHLLCALCAEPEGRVASLLADFGIIGEHLCVELLEQNSPPQFPPPPIVDETQVTNLAQGFYRILRTARRIALECSGEATVATEHVLVALAQTDERCRSCLEKLGLPLERLEARMQPEPGPLQMDEPLSFETPMETQSLARIIDANYNRAREALRVVEDYCRFVLNDAYLQREWRQIRHQLSEILARSGLALLAARDTPGDVGTPAGSETSPRHSFRAVVRANASRVQEALRTLEEYLRLRQADLSAQLAALRYRTYTLEKATLGMEASQEALANARLCVIITGALCVRPLEWTVKEALAGGADIIQLREKSLPDREWLLRAELLRRWTAEARALFIVNDRPDIARLAGADGVHVGQDDLPLPRVRRLVGAEFVIGVSTHNLEQLRQAITDGASYVGVGPVFTTSTKPVSELAGLEYVRQAAAETALPAFAIGGITPANVEQVVQAGLNRVAVSSVVCRAENPRAIVQEIRRVLDTVKPA
jgi:thiamine-phosphate pyrophosphorylase